MRGRFAPSPTGDLHLGNARTALLAWARARSTGGGFVLRVEDLDGPRTVPAAVAGNLEELRWLGLDWDEGPDVGGPHAPYLQSQRTERYEQALGRLRARGGVYECFLSRKDVAASVSAPHGSEARPYGAAERAHNERVAAERRAEGRSPSLRYRFRAPTLQFEDARHGRQVVDVEHAVGDVIVRRSDGLFAYALAVVVDDADMGIEEVVRGDDLLAATAPQVLLAEALGLRRPAYLHVPLLLDVGGVRLAKRRGDRTLRSLMTGGADPARLRGALWASAGLLDAPRALTAREVIDLFDPSRLRPEAARWTRELEAWALAAAAR